MRKIISPVIIVLLTGFIGYEHHEVVLDHAKYLMNDPAQKVLNANLPETDTVETFQSESYGEISLLAGTEEDYGLRHILARHTKDYFINFKDKNEDSLFPDDVSGKNIVLGINDFFKHCVMVPPYNNHPDRNTAYIGYTEIKHQLILCLLITETERQSIVTFYPFDQKAFEPDRRPVIID